MFNRRTIEIRYLKEVIGIRDSKKMTGIMISCKEKGGQTKATTYLSRKDKTVRSDTHNIRQLLQRERGAYGGTAANRKGEDERNNRPR